MKKLLLTTFACMLLCTSADAEVRKAKKPAKKTQKHTKRTYYYNSDGSLSDKPAGASKSARPSSYKGDNVPENDGQKKNEHRNINYNSGQPLPSNSGK